MDPSVLDRIANNLANIGAISLEDYLDGHSPAYHQPCASVSEATEGNAITLLHQTCQRTFRNTDALKFEFVDTSSRNKQCILTITKPDGVRRSYATQPVFAKKTEAKSEVAKIAIEMGALDFLTGGNGQNRPIRDPACTSVEASVPSDAMSMSTVQSESLVGDIEKCCVEWRAGHVVPHWVPFSDPKLPHKLGYALRIQLSPHVSRIYLSDPAFDTHSDAKGACAMAAVCEGVLEFIKHGNGQMQPSSPIPQIPSTLRFPPVNPTGPWTLQAFYDSLPRPFPEPFQTSDASEINPLGWINNMMQNARGGKLVLGFFFTSDGPPGLHGCILKLDRPGEYRAYLVDARFPKRSDAKSAACFQAMSEGIGDYIRSIISAVDNKITPVMRSFSSGMVYPALASALSKLDSGLHPRIEYTKERDAFGATMIVGLSMLPTAEQVRQYRVPSDYRSKADAKIAVVCHGAERGVVEFVRFRGGPPPDGYVSGFSLGAYNPEAVRKRKQPGSMDEAEQGQPPRKKKKGKRKAEVSSGNGNYFTPVGQFLSIHSSGDQTCGIPGPGDMGPSRNVPADGSWDPSQPGVGVGSRSGGARPAAYGDGPSHDGRSCDTPYPAVLDPRFAGDRGYGIRPPSGSYSGLLPNAINSLPSNSAASRTTPGSSLRRPIGDAELEPGEVVSSAESEFSVSSSRNDDGNMEANERGMGVASAVTRAEISLDKDAREDADAGAIIWKSVEKRKAKEMSPAHTATSAATVNYVQNLKDHCMRHGCGTPSFHEVQRAGRFLVWIVIGKERYDLPTTYGTAEEGWQRVARQVLARLTKTSSGVTTT